MNNDLLMSLEVTITVELGRKKMRLHDIIKTSHGTVIELDKKVGEPLTFYVNDKPFGTCEIVQFNNGKMGMKILQIFQKNKK